MAEFSDAMKNCWASAIAKHELPITEVVKIMASSTKHHAEIQPVHRPRPHSRPHRLRRRTWRGDAPTGSWSAPPCIHALPQTPWTQSGMSTERDATWPVYVVRHAGTIGGRSTLDIWDQQLVHKMNQVWRLTTNRAAIRGWWLIYMAENRWELAGGFRIYCQGQSRSYTY